MNRFKNKKAQQLVEFLLVAPFIVIFLGILTEYAYALNCNLTLTQGLKNVTASIYKEIVPNITPAQVRNLVKTDLQAYLQQNNVPVGGDYAVDVAYNLDSSNANAVFVASYNYVPAFTLPNVFFHIMPDKFTFMATSSIPAAFLSSNSYNALSSTDLDKIWSTGDFSSLDSFNSSKNGIMNKTISNTVGMLFLIPITTVASGFSGNNFYSVVNWDGSIESSLLNTKDGYLYTCSLTDCTSTGATFMNNYNGYYNFIFVHDMESSAISSGRLGQYWTHLKTPPCDPATFTCTPISAGDKISDSTVDGILKRSLAIIDVMNMSTGNYDNLPVSFYNPSAAASNNYSMSNYGSAIFIYNPTIDDISKLKTGAVSSLSGSSSEFGTKVP